MERKKKTRKRYKLKARFYCIIFSLLIVGGLSFKIFTGVHSNELPNFYGWYTEAVMEFEEEHPNISIIYELAYSETVRPTRVISQSLQPGIEIGEEPIVLTVQISKGTEVAN